MKKQWLWIGVMGMLAISQQSDAATNSIKYTYDALGRLTFVNDPLNGNRDYDYDKAGNRLLVKTNTSSDTAAEPSGTPPAQPPPPPPPGSTTIPPAPTSLFSTQNSQCSWSASWSSSFGATSYNFRDASGNHTLTVSTTQVSYGFSSCSIDPTTEKPKWVQACNSVGCSAQSYFP